MTPKIALGSLVCALALSAHAAQTPPRDIRPDELAQWDSSSKIYNKQGDVLTAVNVRNGRLDFSRPEGKSRSEFLRSLYAQGMRQVFAPLVSRLELDEQGLLLLKMSGNEGVAQALREKEGGFDLIDAEGSQILDSKSRLLATVSTLEGAPSLTLPEGHSLESVYQAGLRVFYYRAQYVNDRPALRGVQMSKDGTGKVQLKP